MPRFIPRRWFEYVALALLPGSVLLAGYWFLMDAGLYRWWADWLGGQELSGVGLSLLMTLLTNLVATAVIVALIRPFVIGMEGLSDQLGREWREFREEPGTLKEKMARAVAEDEASRQNDPQAIADHRRQMGIILIGVGLALGVASLAILLINEGRMILQIQLTLLLLAIGLVGMGAWQLLTPPPR